MWIFWIAFLVGLIFLIKWIIQQSKPGEQKPKEDPVEILKKRYAREEIDKEEFEKKRKIAVTGMEDRLSKDEIRNNLKRKEGIVTVDVYSRKSLLNLQ